MLSAHLHTPCTKNHPTDRQAMQQGRYAFIIVLSLFQCDDEESPLIISFLSDVIISQCFRHGTALIPSPPPVSALEAKLYYYYGLFSNPRLIARTAGAPVKPPQARRHTHRPRSLKFQEKTRSSSCGRIISRYTTS